MTHALKHPSVLVALIGALLLGVGALGGWLEYSNQLIATSLYAELGQKESIVVFVAATAAIFILSWAALHKIVFIAAALLAGLYGAMLVLNQLPSSGEVALVGVSINAFYWMSLVGAVCVVLGSFSSIIQFLRELKANDALLKES